MIRHTTSAGAIAFALLAAGTAHAAEPVATTTAATTTLPQAEAAQDASASAGTAASADPSDDIVVLGTRRTDRTLANSPSPVDVISAAELTTQPSANMIDQLKNIVPSFYAGQNSISDASMPIRIVEGLRLISDARLY